MYTYTHIYIYIYIYIYTYVYLVYLLTATAFPAFGSLNGTGAQGLASRGGHHLRIVGDRGTHLAQCTSGRGEAGSCLHIQYPRLSWWFNWQKSDVINILYDREWSWWWLVCGLWYYIWFLCINDVLMLLNFTYHHGRFFHLSTGINGLPSQPETPQDFPMIFSWANPANPLKKGSPFASEHVEIHRKLNVLGMDQVTISYLWLKWTHLTGGINIHKPWSSVSNSKSIG